MKRDETIKQLQAFGTVNVEIGVLEQTAKQTDTEDPAGTLISLVVSTEDDSHDLVEGSDYPIRIRFGSEDIRGLAPNLHEEFFGVAALSAGSIGWEKIPDAELEGMVKLVHGLPDRNDASAIDRLQPYIQAQETMIRYRATYRPKESSEEQVVVVWGRDADIVKQLIGANFGSVISLEPGEPMVVF